MIKRKFTIYYQEIQCGKWYNLDITTYGGMNMNKKMIVASLIIMFIVSSSIIGQAKESTPQFVYTHIGTSNHNQYDWYVGTHNNIAIFADGAIVYHIFSYSKESRSKIYHYYIYDYKTQKILINKWSGMEDALYQYGGIQINTEDRAKWIDVKEAFGHFHWIPDELAFRTVINFLKHNLEDVADFRKDKSVLIIPE